MYALVDVNSFYASCETVFRPDLRGRPIVVLSNNDGCIISLSKEAKTLGIKMGAPYFKLREELLRHNVVVFSSNYALYGDMSQRVMNTLEQISTRVDTYSIDKSKMPDMVTQ
jgi:DNA polymerase V